MLTVIVTDISKQQQAFQVIRVNVTGVGYPPCISREYPRNVTFNVFSLKALLLLGYIRDRKCHVSVTNITNNGAP